VRAIVLGIGFLAGLCALLAAGPVANAAIVTQTQSFTLTAPQVTDKVIQTDGVVTRPAADNNSPQTASHVFSFAQFDDQLGTLSLLGVSITFTTTYGATATVTVDHNGDDDTINFSSAASVNHTLSGSAIDPQSSLQQFSATCKVVSGGSCPKTTNADTGISFPASPPGSFVLAVPITSFVGAGTFDLAATLDSALAPKIFLDNGTDNGTKFADNSTFSGTLDATWDVELSVVYTYETAGTGGTSVPLPSSLYLLTAGLGGIALWRRSRR